MISGERRIVYISLPEQLKTCKRQSLMEKFLSPKTETRHGARASMLAYTRAERAGRTNWNFGQQMINDTS